jgi:hypothetical protein
MGFRAALQCVALVCAAASLLPASGAAAQSMQMDDGMMMVGNPHQYPNLAKAGKANVAHARSVMQATLAKAARFNTVAKARALGYVPKVKLRRPGFTHFRKFGTRFWGAMFDAAAPQSLVFWCPSSGACKLALFMYRAPSGDPPDTWGNLLRWHRHAENASWMMHLWLVDDVRLAYASCAPMNAVAKARGFTVEHYHPDVMPDTACKPEKPGHPLPAPGE